jgi:hypothetical protein
MMCYYLNVHFQGQRVKVTLIKCGTTSFHCELSVPKFHYTFLFLPNAVNYWALSMFSVQYYSEYQPFDVYKNTDNLTVLLCRCAAWYDLDGSAWEQSNCFEPKIWSRDASSQKVEHLNIGPLRLRVTEMWRHVFLGGEVSKFRSTLLSSFSG